MSIKELFGFIGDPVYATIIAALSTILVVLLLHAVATAIARRFTSHYRYARTFVDQSVGPLRLLLPMLALQAVWEAAPPGFPGLAAWRHTTLVLIIAAVTWLVTNALMGVRDLIFLRFPLDVADNLEARRVRTQTTVLLRILSAVAILLGASAALMTFPGVRHIGASLLASAGLAGVVVGFAARPVLGNIIAGLQIAMTQPIRIDDVVIVEGEWGRVEEITGAFVVVKIWDERRLVIPLQWFIEHPFQNWTRTGAQLLGTVYLWLDFRTPLEPLRQELQRICAASPEWDQRVCSLQVTEVSQHTMQLRALVSAADSGRTWDLRCRVREALIAFLQREHPESLPRMRAELTGEARAHHETAVAEGDADALATARGRATPEKPGNGVARD